MPAGDADPAAPLRLADEPPLPLADLLLTPAVLRLAGPAGTVEVEPLVMRLLLLLARPPGQVRSREAIMAALWPNATVGDDSLHRAVAKARRALAVCGAAAAIETVPRTGYRLVVEAATLAPQSDSRPESQPATPATPSVADPSRRRWLALAAGGGLALAGAALWRRQALSRRPPQVAALLAQAQLLARLAEPEADRQGAGLLQAAARLAPDDALVWGRLALALRAMAEYAPPPRDLAALAETEAAARRALAIDAAQPDARTALVLLQPIHGNWWAAERGFAAILADVPDHLPSLDGLSMVEAGAGLIRAHYPLRRRTVALDPLHAGYNFRSIYAHWMNGDLAAADRAGARGLELWPRHIATWHARIGLFAMSGRPERALAMLADDATRPRLPPAYRAMLETAARALGDGGQPARARALAEVMALLDGGGPFLAVVGSMLMAALGAPDRALLAIEALLLERGPLMVEPNWRPGQMLHNDVRRRFTNFLFTPVMAPVWDLPGFDAVTRAIGLADYWRQSGHQPDFRAVAGPVNR